MRASGYLSPPSRPLVGLLNFAAIEGWTGVRSERLHGGDIQFKPGYDLDSWRHLGSELGWDTSAFRCLHVCFVRRSSGEGEPPPKVGRICRVGRIQARADRHPRTCGSPRRSPLPGLARGRRALESREVPPWRARGGRRLTLPRVRIRAVLSVVVVTYEWPEALDLVLLALSEQSNPSSRSWCRRRVGRPNRGGRRVLAWTLRRRPDPRVAARQRFSACASPQSRCHPCHGRAPRLHRRRQPAAP